ncbi:septation ring formation regulator EzrA [Rubeoparvulum massiliense]|uniref:septation ring formation regulator EzrA n=1 Tax=Rubeoparvulum massiliense TaxID=1631346 RepID=UPI00065E8279|nr:septation ring formation regulator EzrA [Rubeoparvulum massiliense]
MSEAATIKRTWILILIYSLVFTLTVGAVGFPKDKDALVIDEENYFIRQQIESLTQNIQSKAAAFRVVILSKADSMTTQEYTNQLFDELKIPDDGLLLVMAMETGEIVAKPGKALIELGIDGKLITQKINTLIVPNAEHNMHLEGISTFIDSIDGEITTARHRQATLESSIVDKKAEQNEDANVLGMPFWLKLILGLTILAALALAYIYWMRHRMLRMVEDLSTIKLDLEERLTNYTGIPGIAGLSIEQQRRIQEIKQSWKKMAEEHLPNFEMNLFEIEEEISHLHFIRAKQMMMDADQLMDQVEQQAIQMVEDWQDWIDQTENVQDRAIEVERIVVQIQQELLVYVNDGKLVMDSIQEEWKQLHELREELQTLAKEERMAEATPILDEIESIVEKLKSFTSLIPHISEEMEVTIPNDLDQLTQFANEMEVHGFALREVGFYEEIEQVRKNWALMLTQFHEGNIRDMIPQVQELKQQLDKMFQHLEEEVSAKERTGQALQRIHSSIHTLQEKQTEVEHLLFDVKQHYRLQDDEAVASQAMANLPQIQEEMEEKIVQIEGKMKGKAPIYNSLYQELLTIEEELQKQVELCEEWVAKLHYYQQSEDESLDRMEQLYRRLIKLENQLRRTNLPALPGDLVSALEIAGLMLDEADEKLIEEPFDVLAVQQQLDELEKQVYLVEEKSIETITACEEAENVIQYAYRYRNDPEAEALLKEAENSFRLAEFNQAIEFVNRILERYESD